jgi:Transcription elongation factor, GreA/GreB, C-term
VLQLPLPEPRRGTGIAKPKSAEVSPPPLPVSAGFDEPIVEVQDSVVYAFKSDPERRITITITHRTHDPDRGYLAKGHPLVQELLGAQLGDEVEVPVGTGKKLIVVLEIIKAGQEPSGAGPTVGIPVGLTAAPASQHYQT